MSVYYSKIAAIYPDFPKEYKNWMSNNNNFLFSPVELNDRYNDYRKVIPLLETMKLKAVNYNELVEEILRMNPHPIVNPVVSPVVKVECRQVRVFAPQSRAAYGNAPQIHSFYQSIRGHVEKCGDKGCSEEDGAESTRYLVLSYSRHNACRGNGVQ
eukprot:TRINITY_DN8752_c0_g1_i15.p1 TRINITY_DN8752_c0_g1~~TRINITY_DN8752_c0_g1_i15.p1  ORF type:complete len:156 (-),score=14.68 TRINITY_DN8752_c0_g1_i15:226-693(-)